MHRCSCSTRALETFVKEFAGIDLRRQRAQRFFQRTRAFSTRPPLRQIETTIHTHADDGFIPFDLKRSGHQDSVAPAKPTKEAASKADGDSLAGRHGGQDEGDAEWHAEVEIIELDILQQGHFSLVDATIDTVRLPETSTEVPSRDDANLSAPILHLPAISQHLSPDNSQTPPKAESKPGRKTASRKLRKARRKEAGTFKPSADANLTALDKIEMLEGPSVVVKRERPAVQEAIAESAAKDEGVQKRAGRRARTGARVAVKTKENKDVSTKATTTPRATAKAKIVKKETWQVQKAALDRKFGEQGWQPRKRLSPDTLEGIRALHASDPASYSTATLAENFQITPEAIRRVLRSKWRPKPEEIEDRMKRWENRGARKWEEMSATGVKPPKRWREMGVRNPLLKKKIKMRLAEHSDEANWKRAEDLADRLPFEGSFAERLL